VALNTILSFNYVMTEHPSLNFPQSCIFCKMIILLRSENGALPALD